MNLERVAYADLTSKQKEVFNFQKAAAQLADYGFNCIKLDDDWQGADFLAYHKDGEHTLKVQLKARLGIYKKYAGKDLYICFPHGHDWYLIPHDDLVSIAGDSTGWLRTKSWQQGGYSTATPSGKLLERLAAFKLGGPSPCGISK